MFFLYIKTTKKKGENLGISKDLEGLFCCCSSFFRRAKLKSKHSMGRQHKSAFF